MLSGHLHILICGVLVPIFSAVVLKLLHGTHVVQGLGLGTPMVGGLGLPKGILKTGVPWLKAKFEYRCFKAKLERR